MEREIIINFISANFSDLASIAFVEGSVCLFGKQFNSDIVKIFKKEDKFFVYQIKLPRVYQKELPFEEINEGIIAYAISCQEQLILKKEEFTYELIDPYYKKDIRSISFKYLYIVPLNYNDKMVGVILLYANAYNENFLINKKSLTKLINSLYNVDEMMLDKSLQNVLKGMNNYYVLCGEKKYYFSDGIRDYFHLDVSIIDIDKINYYPQIDKLLKSDFVNKTNLNVGLSNVKLLYLDVNLLNNHFPLSIKAFSFFKISELFFVFFFNCKEINELKRIINDLIYFQLILDFHLFDCGNDLYMIYSPYEKEINSLKDYLAENTTYYIFIYSPKQIQKEIDFGKLSNYINNERPSLFSFNDYLKYIDVIGKEYAEINDIFRERHVIYNSVERDNKYQLINFFHNKIIANNVKKKFQEATITYIEKNYINNSEQQFAFFAYSSMCSNKTFINLIKKLQEQHNDFFIILLCENNNIEIFLNVLKNLKMMNVKVLANSSVFLDLRVASSIKLFDGFFYSKDEFILFQQSPQNLTNFLINYLLSNDKLIVFEKTNTNLDVLYKDRRIFFADIDKKGKEYHE